MLPRVLGSCLLILCATSVAHAEDCYGTHTLGGCFSALGVSGPAEPGPFRSMSLGRALPYGSAAFSANAWYLVRPAELVVSSQDPEGRTLDVVSRATVVDLRSAVGLGRSIDLTLALPIYADIRGAGPDAIASQKPQPVQGAALGDVRVGVRSSLLPATDESMFRLMLRNEWTLPTGNASKYTGDNTATSTLAITGAWQYAGWSAAIDAGYRAAPALRFGDVRLGSAALFGLGFARDIIEPGVLSIGIEAWANPVLVASPTTDMPTNSNTPRVPSHTLAVPAEWMANIQVHPESWPFWAWMGGGSALPLSSRDVVNNPSQNVAFEDAHFIAPSAARIRLGLGLGFVLDGTAESKVTTPPAPPNDTPPTPPSDMQWPGAHD